jgi:Na+-transporting NADH:ubiquinone oxidoreductase subunit NqrB
VRSFASLLHLPEATSPEGRWIRCFRQGKKFFRTPKGFLLPLLILLVLLAAPGAGIDGVARNLLGAILTAVFLDMAIVRICWHTYSFPSGALITGLIIAMILSPQLAWYIPVFASALAILSKHVLKIRRRPIFNPAAVGLLGASLFFASGQDWWGALAILSPWWIIVLIIIGFLVTDRVNKFPQVFAFAASYFGLFTFFPLMGTATPKIAEIFRMPFINACLFFAFIMLTDPPTSPITEEDQIQYGVLVALASGLIYLIFGLLSFLPLGLLIGNAFIGWQRLSRSASSSQAG